VIYGSIISLDIIPGFINTVYIYRYGPDTQKKPPKPDEVYINSSQDFTLQVDLCQIIIICFYAMSKPLDTIRLVNFFDPKGKLNVLSKIY